MRQTIAYLVGLALPIVGFVAIVHVSGERAERAELHVERVSSPIADAVMLGDAHLLLAKPLADAVLAVVREGSNDVPMEGTLKRAWEQLSALAGGSDRILVEVEDVLVLIEARAKDDPASRTLDLVWSVGEKVVAAGRGALAKGAG